MSTLSDAAWLDLLHRAASGESVEVEGRSLPLPPDVQLQINTVGHAGPAAMDEAWAFATECLARFRASPLFGDHDRTLLDFGTGWGRIARCFLRDVRAEDMIGVDVSPELVAVCQANFHGPRFLCCDPMPPLPLTDGSVDFVVGYSVFSHLSEAACRAWMAEFARVLKPGGMAALTTRGRWFFDFAASLTDTSDYAQALSKMFPDFSEAKARYDRGEFVHSNMAGVTGGGVLDGSFYGETFIPERFARETLGTVLRLREFHVSRTHVSWGSRLRGILRSRECHVDREHPIMFFEKPGQV
jgi:SAM-dependent methyltransferase